MLTEILLKYFEQFIIFKR